MVAPTIPQAIRIALTIRQFGDFQSIDEVRSLLRQLDIQVLPRSLVLAFIKIMTLLQHYVHYSVVWRLEPTQLRTEPSLRNKKDRTDPALV